jgi:hypothetical protein
VSSTIIYLAATATPIDSSLVALPVQVTHGRSANAAQPDAPVLEFEYYDTVPPCAAGDLLRLEHTGTEPDTGGGFWGDPAVTWGDLGWTWNGNRESTSTRFVGEVDSVTAIEVDGVIDGWKVRAVGRLAALGRIGVREERPIEDDVTRVLAIAAKAGVTINIAGTAGMQLAIDELDRDCLGALHQVCESTGGLVWQDRFGDFWYGTANHRAGTTDWVLPAKAILDGLEWTKEVEQVLNHLTIRYPREVLPPPPLTGEWTWDPSLDTGTDPGTGDMRANDVNATQVSTIALSAMTSGGVDATLSITRRLAGDRLYIQEKADSTKWARYTLTGPPVDNGDWFSVSVDFKEHGEVGEPVQNNQSMLVSFDSRLEGGERQETFSDTASMAQWGERHVEFSTLCADADEAAILALTILARRAQPFWAMPGVLVPYFELTPADAATMQALEVSDGLLAPVPTAPGPTPSGLMQWAVEGWVEEWREDGHWMQLSLSDWARFSAAGVRTYQIVADTLTYGQAAAKTYRELLVEVI